ncbi:periplasmic heavy metal sensor [Prosthecobacter sp.]|uniref:periplasmic heavy metal sensor n=1 Tax=Prosthecobacter sp. TaxID=1965333 RepID=UPI002ABC90E8|nr:periplasmic heavy metal sensor [Prosthecobacter sp.]MDZ4403206.1 periplasmic heavy metal sensor [Prosthecobacter sp.]
MTSRGKWMVAAMLFSVVLAGGTAWLVTDWTLHRHGESHAHDHAEPDFHAWMHEHLDITPEQHEKLEPIEAEFEQRRVRLRGEIRAAGRDLAAAIETADVNDDALKSALEKLNKAQAELQHATLEHFFAMKRYLRPAQAKKLVEWTHDSLAREH